MTDSHGTPWTVVNVGQDRHGARRGDGDTCWLTRTRVQLLGDKPFHVQDVDPVSVRLVWVDTPERGDNPGYKQAAADLTSWLDSAVADGPLTVWIYPASAGWDRLLGDIISATGESASQWLMTARGWPPYIEEGGNG